MFKWYSCSQSQKGSHSESKVRILMKEVWGVREEREVKRSVWDARWRVAGADVHHMNRTRVV